MVESCRVFTYSANNPYANDYYNACSKFDNARNKVIEYEQKTNDRESPEYKKLIAEFREWDEKVPSTSNIAGAWEKETQKQKESLARQEDIKKEQYTQKGLGNNLYITA